jgi:hypothetical protein
MKTKSAYREKIPAAENNPTPRVEIDDQPVQPSETTHIEFADKAEPVVVEEKQYYPEPEPDEATAALLHQLAHLRASEQAQKEFATQVAAQRAAQMAAPAPTLPDGPEVRIAIWRQQGLTDDDASFLQQRPDMVNNPALTRLAYGLTLQAGVPRDSPDFAAAMEGNFASLLNRAQAQSQPAAADPAGFFAPRPAPSPAAVHEQRASIVSAPVSRREVGGHRELSPSQVRLSAAEVEMAKASGVTERQYAEGKLRMMKLKALGEIP